MFSWLFSVLSAVIGFVFDLIGLVLGFVFNVVFGLLFHVVLPIAAIWFIVRLIRRGSERHPVHRKAGESFTSFYRHNA